MSKEAIEKRQGNGCRIAVRRRKGPASGLALRAPLPRRAGMRRAETLWQQHFDGLPDQFFAGIAEQHGRQAEQY